jgi:hypothetical protein
VIMTAEGLTIKERLMRLAQVIYYFSFMREVSKERCTRCNVGRPRVTRQSSAN